MVWQQAVVQGITDAMTTPYAGGDWEVEQYSTLTPEQRTALAALTKRAGSGKMFKAAKVSMPATEDLSISSLNRVREEQALASLEGFMNTEADQGVINTQTQRATEEAKLAAEAVNLNFAGRGSSSSASNRARGQITSDLGAKIAEIISSEENRAAELRLQGAQGYGNLAATISGQDLQTDIANRDSKLALAQMQQGVNIANAQAKNQMTAAEADFLLKLATTPITENIATQTEEQTLHRDLWSQFSNNPGESLLGIVGSGLF